MFRVGFRAVREPQTFSRWQSLEEHKALGSRWTSLFDILISSSVSLTTGAQAQVGIMDTRDQAEQEKSIREQLRRADRSPQTSTLVRLDMTFCVVPALTEFSLRIEERYVEASY